MGKKCNRRRHDEGEDEISQNGKEYKNKKERREERKKERKKMHLNGSSTRACQIFRVSNAEII